MIDKHQSGQSYEKQTPSAASWGEVGWGEVGWGEVR